jgi:hypothetical protein
MNEKQRNILNWVLAGLVAFIFISSGGMKLSGSPEAVKMASDFGIDASSFTMIAVVEILSALIFLYPRTGVIGTLLLAAYMGGAIATHIEHGQSIMAPAVIEAIVWVVAAVRFPELTERLMGKR